MKKILLIFALGICCSLQTTTAQTDAKAKAVLDAVSKKVTTLKSLKADFALNLIGGKGGKVTDSKKGTFSLKGQKYHILISGQEIISDNKTIWTYNKDAKEVQISNYNPSEQTFSPAKLFTPNFYDKDYKYSYIGEKKEKNNNCDVIELVPKDNTKQLAKIDLLVDKATSMIVGGDYWEKNGNKYHISVSNALPNANIPDSYFTWDPKEHPGVEAVDLR
jgi:outer membrane lipoprotein carrier protein